MKIRKTLPLSLLVCITAFSFTSCKSDDPVDSYNLTNGVVVLNEGKYNGNNASISYYDFDTQKTYSDVFTDKNNRGLGDTGQDMIKYGSKLYIAVYNSSLIEVVDAKTGVSKKSISMVNDANAPSYPRSLTAANGKVYIVLYDGHVTQLDTTSLSLGSKITVGANPDCSVISNNKLYVANTGGMAAVNDSTVSVINLSTFTEEKRITVNLNPSTIQADSEGDIYVASNGNYGTIAGKFQRIDAQTGAVSDIAVSVRNFCIMNDKAYIYNFSYDANYNVSNKTIAVYDVKNEKLLNSSLVSTTLDNTPYCIAVDPSTNYIYVGTSDYSTLGKMYCFDSTGAFKYSFTTGINPSKVVFINK